MDKKTFVGGALAVVVLVALVALGWYYRPTNSTPTNMYVPPSILEIHHSIKGAKHIYDGSLLLTECQQPSAGFDVIESTPQQITLKIRVMPISNCTNGAPIQKPFTIGFGVHGSSTPMFSSVTINGKAQEFKVIEATQ